MASADFSFALTKELSPGKVLFLSLHTVRLYLARLDGLWASLRPASLPPVRGLSADSCSYGQRFVPRFLQLGRAACAPRLPLCGSLRLPPSVPVSTLQLTRNSPCWAHWRGPPGLQRRPPGRRQTNLFSFQPPPQARGKKKPARMPALPARRPALDPTKKVRPAGDRTDRKITQRTEVILGAAPARLGAPYWLVREQPRPFVGRWRLVSGSPLPQRGQHPEYGFRPRTG